MASLQIKARVDSEQWKAVKLPKETSTEAVQRILTHYQATYTSELEEIDPNPSAALAVLLHSHKMLMQLIGNASVALPAEAQAEEPATQKKMTALEIADEW